MALKNNTPTAPWWVAILDAAETWGVLPWKLTTGSPTIWWLRFQVYRHQEARVQKALENERKRK